MASPRERVGDGESERDATPRRAAALPTEAREAWEDGLAQAFPHAAAGLGPAT